jgi:hypothetical protein
MEQSQKILEAENINGRCKINNTNVDPFNFKKTIEKKSLFH